MPTFVVISGLPASGKTTIGQALARCLDVDHLDKDVFLEALFGREEIIDLDRRRTLSRVASPVAAASIEALAARVRQCAAVPL